MQRLASVVSTSGAPLAGLTAALAGVQRERALEVLASRFCKLVADSSGECICADGHACLATFDCNLDAVRCLVAFHRDVADHWDLTSDVLLRSAVHSGGVNGTEVAEGRVARTAAELRDGLSTSCIVVSGRVRQDLESDTNLSCRWIGDVGIDSDGVPLTAHEVTNGIDVDPTISPVLPSLRPSSLHRFLGAYRALQQAWRAFFVDLCDKVYTDDERVVRSFDFLLQHVENALEPLADGPVLCSLKILEEGDRFTCYYRNVKEFAKEYDRLGVYVDDLKERLRGLGRKKSYAGRALAGAGTKRRRGKVIIVPSIEKAEVEWESWSASGLVPDKKSGDFSRYSAAREARPPKWLKSVRKSIDEFGIVGLAVAPVYANFEQHPLTPYGVLKVDFIRGRGVLRNTLANRNALGMLAEFFSFAVEQVYSSMDGDVESLGFEDHSDDEQG